MKTESYVLFPFLVVISTIFMQGSSFLSRRFNLLMDKPNMRSSHSGLIPRCAGIPIVVLFFCFVLFFADFSDWQIVGFLFGGLLIAFVGLLDDFINLRGKYKIAGMVLSSMLPMFFGLKLNYIGIPNSIALYILSFLWIYGMINAFNFMDGIDGLMGGIAVIFAFFVLVLSLMSGNNFVGLTSLILSGICLSFLFFNYSPASIFLGDMGSMFLGYNFALLSILMVNQSDNSIPIYAFVLVFGVIIYDAMLTFVRRGLEGKNVIAAHREHLYQRLIIMGFSHRSVSVFYYLLSILFGVAAVFFIGSAIEGKIMIIFAALLILISFSFCVRRLEHATK